MSCQHQSPPTAPCSSHETPQDQVMTQSDWDVCASLPENRPITDTTSSYGTPTTLSSYGPLPYTMPNTNSYPATVYSTTALNVDETNFDFVVYSTDAPSSTATWTRMH